MFSNPLVVFSGGMPRAAYGDRHTVTVMQGASHVALDFSSRVIDFLCTYGEAKLLYIYCLQGISLYGYHLLDNGEPVSLIVLLEEEITAFDITQGKSVISSATI